MGFIYHLILYIYLPVECRYLRDLLYTISLPAGGSVQCEEAPYLGVLLGEGSQLQRGLGAAELQPPVQPGGRGQLLPDSQGGQLHLVQPLHQTRSAMLIC